MKTTIYFLLLIFSIPTFGQTNYTSKPHTYSKPQSQLNGELMSEVLRQKDQQYRRAVAEYNRQIEKANREIAEKEYYEKQKAIALRSQVIDIYNDSSIYPSKIKDGWHEVYSTNNYDFTAKRKVYVENNKITKYIVDNLYRRKVTSSLPISKGKASIEINDSENLLTIYFINAIYNPSENSTPPEKVGKVTFWSNYNKGKIDIYIEGDYEGTQSKYFPDKGPSCGSESDAAVVFQGRPGIYNYKGVSGKYTWSGSFTLTENGCTKQKLSK